MRSQAFQRRVRTGAEIAATGTAPAAGGKAAAAMPSWSIMPCGPLPASRRAAEGLPTFLRKLEP
jgi:hypothetical protein